MATINGNATSETLNGTSASDTIYGNGGNDTIRGNGATTGVGDLLYGGDGNDTIYVGNSGRATAHGDAGNDKIYGGTQTANQEFLYGDAGDDEIHGNGGRDYIYGGTGNDEIHTGVDIAGSNGIGTVVDGGDGDDNIWSGGGISDLKGGAGDDIFHANEGLWTGSEMYNGGEGYDKIIADASNQNIGIASIYRVEEISGNAFSNVNIQTKQAASGSSTSLNLTGIKLVDINIIKGQNGNDTITLEGGSGSGNPLYARNDIVHGGNGNDSIYSGLGDDTLQGDAGDDLLVGGVGADLLTGGSGADTFRFTKLADSLVGAADRITDFSTTAGDKIDLSGIDADEGLEGNQEFIFVGTDAFSGVAGELRTDLDAETGYTHIYADTNADLIADFEIVLTNGASLAATDFIL